MQVGLEIAQTQRICLAWERSRPEFNFPPTGVMKSKKASKQAIKQERSKQNTIWMRVLKFYPNALGYFSFSINVLNNVNETI